MTGVTFNPGGTILTDITQSGVVRLWGVATHRQLRRPFPRNGQITAVAFSPNGQILAGVDVADSTVRLWDITADRQIETFVASESNGTVAVEFSPDGRMLAAGYSGGWAAARAGVGYETSPPADRSGPA